MSGPKEPLSSGGVATSAQPILRFEAGGLTLGVFVVEVTRLLQKTGLAAVPFAHPALSGLLDAGELGAVPVFDLAPVLQKDAQVARAVEGATVALFETELGPIGLRMDEMRGITTRYRFLEPSAEERDRLEAMSETGRRALPAVAEDERGRFWMFSLDAFVVALNLEKAGRPQPLS